MGLYREIARTLRCRECGGSFEGWAQFKTGRDGLQKYAHDGPCEDLPAGGVYPAHVPLACSACQDKKWLGDPPVVIRTGRPGFSGVVEVANGAIRLLIPGDGPDRDFQATMSRALRDAKISDRRLACENAWWPEEFRRQPEEVRRRHIDVAREWVRENPPYENPRRKKTEGERARAMERAVEHDAAFRWRRDMEQQGVRPPEFIFNGIER